MKIQDVRYHNLQALLNEVDNNQAELARRVGTNPAYISQILNGIPLPSGKPRSVGERLARKLEQAFDKPDGWMDNGSDQTLVAEPFAGYNAHTPELKRLIILASQLTPTELKMATDRFEEHIGKQGH